MVNVLLIDDAVALREVALAVLNDGGYNVVVAEHGRAALDKLAADPRVGLVVCDINMPVMNGIDFIEAFRLLPGHAQTPVVVLSGATAGEAKLAARQAGATAWLTKPFRPASLLDMVRKLVPP
ncbi:MAG: response regulator [Sulfurisoma sp.]|nr:response regulator [Sulfurisoma sp.]